MDYKNLSKGFFDISLGMKKKNVELHLSNNSFIQGVHDMMSDLMADDYEQISS